MAAAVSLPAIDGFIGCYYQEGPKPLSLTLMFATVEKAYRARNCFMEANIRARIIYQRTQTTDLERTDLLETVRGDNLSPLNDNFVVALQVKVEKTAGKPIATIDELLEKSYAILPKKIVHKMVLEDACSRHEVTS